MKNEQMPSRLNWKEAFSFPLQSPASRRDVFVGGLLLLFLGPVGWILNMGHRLNVVQRLANSQTPYFQGFAPWPHTFKRGAVAALAIALYLSPCLLSSALGFFCYRSGLSPSLAPALWALGLLCFLWGIFTLPGCMTVYAVEGDSSILRHPARAFLHAWAHRRMYVRAWLIGGSSIALSFLGLLGLGFGFLFTSVWAWSVVGYVFTVAMYAPISARA